VNYFNNDLGAFCIYRCHHTVDNYKWQVINQAKVNYKFNHVDEITASSNVKQQHAYWLPCSDAPKLLSYVLKCMTKMFFIRGCTKDPLGFSIMLFAKIFNISWKLNEKK